MMSGNSKGWQAAHPAVRSYASSIGMAPADFRGDGRLVLVVDDQYRVQLRPAPDGRILVSCALMDLGGLAPSQAEGLLVRLATWAAGLLRDHASGLAIEPGGTRLVLQQFLASSCEIGDLKTELEDFINVLSFWSRTCEQEAGRA